MSDFSETYNLTNLITEPTCYKSVENPSCIDLILTNRKGCFESPMTIETGLSDCHKMTVTVMKKHYKKKDPIKILYRNYKSFDRNEFRNRLKETLENSECMDVENFSKIFMNVLEQHAPQNRRCKRK